MGAEGRGNPLPSRFILSSPRFASASPPLPLPFSSVAHSFSFISPFSPTPVSTCQTPPRYRNKRTEELASPLLPDTLLFASTYLLVQPRSAERSIALDASQPN